MGTPVFKVLFIVNLFGSLLPSLFLQMEEWQPLQTENILNKLAPKLHGGVKSVP